MALKKIGFDRDKAGFAWANPNPIGCAWTWFDATQIRVTPNGLGGYGAVPVYDPDDPSLTTIVLFDSMLSMDFDVTGAGGIHDDHDPDAASTGYDIYFVVERGTNGDMKLVAVPTGTTMNAAKLASLSGGTWALVSKLAWRIYNDASSNIESFPLGEQMFTNAVRFDGSATFLADLLASNGWDGGLQATAGTVWQLIASSAADATYGRTRIFVHQGYGTVVMQNCAPISSSSGTLAKDVSGFRSSMARLEADFVAFYYKADADNTNWDYGTGWTRGRKLQLASTTKNTTFIAEGDAQEDGAVGLGAKNVGASAGTVYGNVGVTFKAYFASPPSTVTLVNFSAASWTTTPNVTNVNDWGFRVDGNSNSISAGASASWFGAYQAYD